MKFRQYSLVAFCLVFTLQSMPSFANEYRIASQNDFDKFSTAPFQAGDLILFKRGVRFIGMFSPLGKGTEEAPIQIEVYGQG